MIEREKKKNKQENRGENEKKIQEKKNVKKAQKKTKKFKGQLTSISSNSSCCSSPAMTLMDETLSFHAFPIQLLFPHNFRLLPL